MKLMQGLIIGTVASGMLWAQAQSQPGSTPPAHPKTTAGDAKTAVVPAKPASAPAKLTAGPSQVTSSAAKPAATSTKTGMPAANAVPASAKPTNTAAAKPVVQQTGQATKAPVAGAQKQAATPAPKTAVPHTAETKPATSPKPIVTAKPVTPATSVGKPAKIVDKAAAAEKKVIPNAKPAGTAAAPAAPAGATKPASVKEDDTRVSAGRGNRRDPFVSPIVKASAGGGPACETGKRCLMVDQIELKGIVKSPSGYIAVVENAARRAYFLRENDPVFNGSVVKITGDTIIFREQVVDKLGKQSMREVTKKVNAPAV